MGRIPYIRYIDALPFRIIPILHESGRPEFTFKNKTHGKDKNSKFPVEKPGRQHHN